MLEINLDGNAGIIADMPAGMITNLMLQVSTSIINEIAEVRAMDAEEEELVQAIQDLQFSKEWPGNNPKATGNDHEII